MRTLVPVVVLLVVALLAFLLLGGGEPRPGDAQDSETTSARVDAASPDRGSAPAAQGEDAVESEVRPRVRAAEHEIAAPAVSLERQAELRRGLGRVASSLADRWSFVSFGGAGEDWATLSPEERMWLQGQFFDVAADSPLLPALAWVLRRPSSLLNPGTGRQPPDFSFAYDALLGDDAARARRALRLLRGAVFDPGARTAKVEGALIEATRNERTAADALLALGGVRGASAGIEAFLRAEYDSRAGAGRAAALEGLLRVGDDARWASTTPDARHEDVLRRALADPDPEPRIAALEAIRGAPQAKELEAEVRSSLRFENTDVRNEAIDTAQRIHPLSLDAARELVMLFESDPETSHNALWALSETGHGDKLPVAQLLTSRTPAGHLTCPAIICLRAHGAAAIETLDELMRAVREADVFDASHAVITLRYVAPGDERTFDLLVGQTRRGHYDIEKDACHGLANFGERGVPHIAPKLGLRMHQKEVAAALAVACPDPAQSTAVWESLAELKGEPRAALAAWLRERVPDDPRLAATAAPR